MGAPSKDPSKLKDVVGSTDERPTRMWRRDPVSWWVDHRDASPRWVMVRIEASDMGTATTMKALSSDESARIADGKSISRSASHECIQRQAKTKVCQSCVARRARSKKPVDPAPPSAPDVPWASAAALQWHQVRCA